METKRFKYKVGDSLVIADHPMGSMPVVVIAQMQLPYKLLCCDGRRELQHATYRVQQENGVQYPAAENNLTRPKR